MKTTSLLRLEPGKAVFAILWLIVSGLGKCSNNDTVSRQPRLAAASRHWMLIDASPLAQQDPISRLSRAGQHAIIEMGSST
jgi:hypothetical protein